MRTILDRIYWLDAELEWLPRLEAALSLIDAHWSQSDKDRVSNEQAINGLIGLGLHRMWVSREFGGLQLDLKTGIFLLKTIAQHDASVAWQFGVQGAIGRLSDYLPQHISNKIFGRDGRLVVGSVNPTGHAELGPDGFRLSGEWAFASGSKYADWLVCGAVVTQQGSPLIVNGVAETVMLFVPRSDCEIIDTWHSLGLRATGSNNYRLNDYHVETDYSVLGSVMSRPPTLRESTAYRISYHDFGPLTSSSTAVGIAEDALDAVCDLAKSKSAAASSNALAAGHTVQDRIGRAAAAVISARLLLINAATCAEKLGETGGDQLTAIIRLSASAISERTLAAVNHCTDVAGSSSVYTNSRLERCFRDIHTATKHITLSSSHFEMTGQYILGGPLRMRR